MRENIYWFKSDLRLHDNDGLIEAIQNAKVLPVYIFDPRIFDKTSFGFDKTGAIRASFLIDTVLDLKNKLQKIGADLLIKIGKSEQILPQLIKEYAIDKVFTQKEITHEELEIVQKVEASIDIPLCEYWGSTLFHIDDIPFNEETLPDIFTNFRKKIEKFSTVRRITEDVKQLDFIDNVEETAVPSLFDLGLIKTEIDSRSVYQFKGGETEAKKRVHEFIWDAESIKTYKETRNGMLGPEYSSKLSPWLANGSLSPRYIYWEIKRYEEEKGSNDSTYWMIFELLWRDYFKFSAWKYGARIFNQQGIQSKNRKWSQDKELFKSWSEGKTGIPFIDANMRELNSTGYMSNRGRQNVASFLAQNLNLDWRMGAEWFESKLIDYDPCLNYGNWAYNATIGHDPRNRYFNILGQAERYDPENEYVKHWLPELSNLPDEYIQKPFKLSAKDQVRFNFKLGRDYPKPIIDLEESYKIIKQRG